VAHLGSWRYSSLSFPFSSLFSCFVPSHPLASIQFFFFFPVNPFSVKIQLWGLGKRCEFTQADFGRKWQCVHLCVKCKNWRRESGHYVKTALATALSWKQAWMPYCFAWLHANGDWIPRASKWGSERDTVRCKTDECVPCSGCQWPWFTAVISDYLFSSLQFLHSTAIDRTHLLVLYLKPINLSCLDPYSRISTCAPARRNH